MLPEGLNKFFFTTSGTEANEAAFKIARMYTGKHKIISRYASYHGSTVGLDRRSPAISVAGWPSRATPCRAPCSRPTSTAIAARSRRPIPTATSPAPTTSST